MDKFGPDGNSAPLAQLKSMPQTNPISKGVPPMPDFVVSDLDDKRTDVNVSQPSSSPADADDTYSVPEPPEDAYWPFTESDLLQPKTMNLHLERLRRAGQFKKEETVKKSNMDGIFGVGTPTTSISKPIPQKKDPVSGGSFPAGQVPPADASWPFTESDLLHLLQPQTMNVPLQNFVDAELERLQSATKFKTEETVKKSNMDGIFGVGTPTTSISKPIPQKKEPVSGESFPGGQKPPADASWPFTESDLLHLVQPKTMNVPVQNLVDVELERLRRAAKFKKEETTVKKSNMDGIFGMGTPTTSISKPIPQKKEPVSGGSFPGGQKLPADASWPLGESDLLHLMMHLLQPKTMNVPVQCLVDVELERLRRATKFKKEETVKKSNMDGIFGRQ